MNPRKLYFTSDTHFGHHAVIGYTHRPWKDVDEMDAALIDGWNSVVPADGWLFHLGDVSFRGNAATLDILGRLHGRKVLLRGNHDHGLSAACKAMFEGIHDYLELKVEAQRIVLCHFAFESWNAMHRGAWHLHGHSHGSLRAFGRRVDVGVDCWNGKPMSFDELRTIIDQRPIETRDHHRPKEAQS